MNGELALQVMGGLQLAQGGIPVAGFAYRKSLALLCYLAVTGHPHSREALAGLFWGEVSEESARASLRKALCDLRRLVGTHLQITRQSVATDGDVSLRLDYQDFQSKLRGVSFAPSDPAILGDSDIARLTEAVNLYRGDFLDGFYVHGAPAFEEWVLAERERLRFKMLQSLHRLVIHYTARDKYDLAIEYSRRLLALEPWHEEVCRQLILLLALVGQSGAAVRQYSEFRRILADELGIEPSPETRDLYLQIRAGKVGRQVDNLKDHREAAAARQGAAAGEPREVANPKQAVHIDLAAQRAGLSEAAPAPQWYHLIALDGHTGVTKIDAAMRAVSQLLGAIADTMQTYDLADMDSVNLILATIAESIGGSDVSDGANAAALVVERLRRAGVALDGSGWQAAGVDLMRDVLCGRRQAIILVGKQRS